MQVFGARKTAASSLHDFGALFESAPEPMLVLDAGLLTVAANAAAHDVLALAPQDSVHFGDLVAEDPASVLLRLEKVLDGHALRQPARIACRRTDGAVFPAEITAARFSDRRDGTMIALQLRDRTEAVAALAEVRSEQQLYQTLFELSPIPLREEDMSNVAQWFSGLRLRGVSDLKSYLDDNPAELIDTILGIRTLRVNRAMVELMGAADSSDLDEFDREYLTDEVLDSFRAEFITLWHGGSLHQAEFIGLGVDGEPFECLLTLSAQTADGKRDMSRVIVAIQDVTQVRAYQRTLENLIAGKDRFVASVSHELRTPLAAVLGLSEELHQSWDSFAPEEAQELMGVIARGASDLATLVEDLLLAAKFEVGDGVTAHPTDFELSVEVNAAVADCVAAGELVAAPKITGGAVWCHADPSRVRQVVRNLVSNAARYGGDSVGVFVAASPQPTVRVSDDGPAIDASEWDRIFNPYEQGSGTESVRGALGLGLSISRQLAEIMGGTLIYEHRDAKSMFTLCLPEAVGA